MIDNLTEEQVAAYNLNGFLVIENFLTTNELEMWQRYTDEAVTERLEKTGSELNNQHDPDNFYAQVFIQCLKLADTHEGMHQLMHDPRLGRMAAQLAGVSGIRIWHDQALYKQPFGNPTAWHLDNPYWSFTSKDSLSIWVALDDATMSNGCLYYLPGTHKNPTWKNVSISGNIGDLLRAYPEWRTIDSIACPCPAGSAVFHNGLTAHGAGANMTARPRRAMTCAYMPDGAVFNGTRNILPEEYFSSLHVGDLLNDNTINPLIWAE